MAIRSHPQLFSDPEKKETLLGKTIFSGAATQKKGNKGATEQLSTKDKKLIPLSVWIGDLEGLRAAFDFKRRGSKAPLPFAEAPWKSL